MSFYVESFLIVNIFFLLSLLFTEVEVKSPDAVERLRSRVTGIYSDVVGSDECIERLVCELGGAAKSIYYKEAILR